MLSLIIDTIRDVYIYKYILEIQTLRLKIEEEEK